MIELKDVTKIYKVGDEDFRALDKVSFKVDKGEFISICGASGSGKTTLLNIIGTIDECTEGSYLFEGADVCRMNDGKRAKLRNQHIGFVLQDFALINNQTVLYNVMLPALLGKTPYKAIKAKALKALQSVGIADQAQKKANQLSGGQRQRVAIARALINEPGLILADEPTGQLDSETGKQIMDIFKKLNETGITVITVTHDKAIADYAKRLVVISDGKIVSDSSINKEA
jgi:putative ABC transport system ATP-binding protein